MTGRVTAYEMYLQGYVPKEIAQKTGLNVYTIRKWVTDGSWKDDRDQLQSEMQQNFKIQLRQTMMDNRIKVTLDHMKLGEILEKQAMSIAVTEEGDLRDLSPSQFLDVCRGSKSATDIRARAVGMSDRVDPLAEEVKNSGIIINVGMKAKAHDEPEEPIADVNVIIDDVEVPFG